VQNVEESRENVCSARQGPGRGKSEVSAGITIPRIFHVDKIYSVADEHPFAREYSQKIVK
jgi:hypothetical protein